MKRILVLCTGILLFLCNSGSAQSKRPLAVDDVLSIQDVSDPQISPDGQWIAYVAESFDAKNDSWNKDIYMTPVGGGQPIRLTNSEKNDSSPRWSPDNKYLGFLSSRNKKSQVFLLSRAGGEAIQLTDVKQGVDDFSWSPDGKKLALVIQDPDPDEMDQDEKQDKERTAKPVVLTRLQFLFDEYGFLKELYSHIFIFDLETKSPKQIASGPYDDTAPAWSDYESTPQWSPDGKQILFVSNRTSNPDGNRNTDLFLVSAEGGEPKKLTTNEGTDEAPSWSPDGKWIVYQTNRHPDLIWYDTIEIAVIPAAGGEPKILTGDLDRNCFKALFSADGRRIYFILEDHGTQRLASVPVSGGPINKNVVGENVIDDYDVGRNDSIAFMATRSDLPYEIFAFSKEKSQQITYTNAEVLKGVQFGQVERIEFQSKDGTPVEGFVVKPPQFDPTKKYPLILWIHGGPTSQYMDEFEFRPQILAANGYVVLQVNPRGSTGYGRDFCKAIWADWGNKDYEDVMAGVDAVIAKGYVDADRMGVAGWSYGGMLTDHVITKTNRFKAAMAGASELDYLMDYGTDHYQYEWEKEIGLPWEKPENYTRISPFFKIQNVKTPTLILCGEEDWNVPLINSEQLYQALRRLGVDTMLVVYPGQSHTFYKPSYMKDRYQRYLAWFGHYLQGAPSKVPAPMASQKQNQ